MRHHPAWLAIALLVFVVLACSFGKVKNTNSTNASGETDSQGTSSTSAIDEIHMAKDDGKGNPSERADVFSPGDRTIHCVAKLKEMKSGTKMKFTWWIVDADGSQNQKIKDIDYTTKSLENVIHGHLTVPQNWPEGKYKVEVYVNDNLEKTAFFSVQ